MFKILRNGLIALVFVLSSNLVAMQNSADGHANQERVRQQEALENRERLLLFNQRMGPYNTRNNNTDRRPNRFARFIPREVIIENDDN